MSDKSKEREDQISKIEKLISRVDIPAVAGSPAIDFAMVGPVRRIAGHLYDHGMRVVEETEE